jgi:hypothetical protein
MTRRPFAPALAHIAASVPMLSFRRCVEGWLLSNTHPLQCFPEHPRCKVCCRGEAFAHWLRGVLLDRATIR